MSFRHWLGSVLFVLLCGAATPLVAPAAPGGPPHDAAARTPAACFLPPEVVALQSTQSAPGGRGSMTLLMKNSPYGVSVDADGHYAYEVIVEVTRLRRRGGASYVVWAATPELDQVAKLGALGDGSRVTGTVSWNKFLVFVSEETSPDGETWSGPILLTGLSPSGRMHTMAGHGPFEDVDCQYF
jgi:hypothetical protein